jgi:hypothetical protein
MTEPSPPGSNRSGCGCGWILGISLLIGVIGGAVVGVYTWLSGDDGDTAAEMLEVRGQVVLEDPANFTANGNQCSGRGAFANARAGGSVVVFSARGGDVEMRLEPGVVAFDGSCTISFQGSIAASHEYIVFLGREHSDPIPHSRARRGSTSGDRYIELVAVMG